MLEDGVCMTPVLETGQWFTLWACERGAVPKKTLSGWNTDVLEGGGVHDAG